MPESAITIAMKESIYLNFFHSSNYLGIGNKIVKNLYLSNGNLFTEKGAQIYQRVVLGQMNCLKPFTVIVTLNIIATKTGYRFFIRDVANEVTTYLIRSHCRKLFVCYTKCVTNGTYTLIVID